MNSYQKCKEKLKEKVIEKIDMSRLCEDDEVREIIDGIILEESTKYYISLSEKRRLSREIFHSIRRLDLLQELIDNNEVTEIMVNGTENIFVEINGRIQKWEETFRSKEKLEDVIQQIVAKCNRVVNEASPIVDARLMNGARVNVVLAPVALNGPILTIRRFPEKPIEMEDLIHIGSISREGADFLRKLVISKYNIIISGGTGSGKTTFLNALSEFIPKDERIITIEDSAELQIRGISNLVKLETRNANMEECKEISIRDLIRTALRMRPDRVIVGEVRGGEAIDMLQCFNTGHDGSISTGHANSAIDMLSRIETMALMGMDLPLTAIRRQIASGVDIVIHLGRIRDKSRKVMEIVEVTNYENGEITLNTIYRFCEEGTEKGGKVLGALVKMSEIKNITKWKAAGIS